MKHRTDHQRNTDSAVKRGFPSPRGCQNLEADEVAIEPVEQRLALSASLAGAMLLEVLGVESLDPQTSQADSLSVEIQSASPDPTTANPIGSSPNLLSQAAELRTSRGFDGAGQTVAVIDSGVAWDHIALGGGFGPGYRVVGGWDFAENDANPYDDGPAGYHGTHVSGLLAGSTDGFAGIVPGADIVALRVFDDSGAGSLQWIESALQWVHENQNSFDSPITTINLSVGATLSDANRAEAMAMLEDELALLNQDNILVFAASGNFFRGGEGQNGVLYPASSPSVVAVASVNEAGSLSGFAQRESGILGTRGESIVSAVPDHVFGWDGKVDDFAALDGTSMATPQVAGASMLIRQSMIDEGLEPTADEVLDRLRRSAVERVDPLSGASYHTINLNGAIGEPATSAEEFPSLSRFDGTNQREQVELDLRDGIQMRVGGVTYKLESQSPDATITIDVGGGDDSLRIIGSDVAERLILRPGVDATSSLSTNAYRIELRGFENVTFEGGGGPDRATLFDSASSETLRSRPGQATLSGIGFQFDVLDVPRVFVHATAGGNDTAFLYDSVGDDTLSVRPQFTSLRSSDTFQLAYGFERVYAYASAGGFDAVEMFDSVGDDIMSISSSRSIITGPGYHVSASGFESTEGKATAGGNDVARVYADLSDANWDVTSDRIQWTGQNGAVRIARGFEQAEAFEQFQRVELFQLSANSSLTPWYLEDAKLRAAREADATRALFAALGEQ